MVYVTNAADSPKLAGQAGDVEIKPEIVEAGLSVLLAYYPESASGSADDRQMIQEIIRAVNRASIRRGVLSSYVQQQHGCEHHEP